jgi:hypothetical protein
MTSAEAKAAFKEGEPVVYKDVEYQKISAIIYRTGQKGMYIQAELLDEAGRSVTVAYPQHITIKKEDTNG